MGAKETEVKQHVTISSEAKANIRKTLLPLGYSYKKTLGGAL